MAPFTKPSRSRPEPAGLDTFAAGAPLALAPLPPREAPPNESPLEERETFGMNVRFTAREKATLLELARREDRSQHQILKRLLAPILTQAALDLERP